MRTRSNKSNFNGSDESNKLPIKSGPRSPELIRDLRNWRRHNNDEQKERIVRGVLDNSFFRDVNGMAAWLGLEMSIREFYRRAKKNGAWVPSVMVSNHTEGGCVYKRKYINLIQLHAKMQLAANLHLHGVIELLERLELAILPRPVDPEETFDNYFLRTNVFGNMVDLSGKEDKYKKLYSHCTNCYYRLKLK
jgi:hypothetical protein